MTGMPRGVTGVGALPTSSHSAMGLRNPSSLGNRPRTMRLPMQQSDYPHFKALLERLAEVYGKKLTDELISACWDALRDQPFARVKQMAEAHLRKAKFFPKPCELRPKEDPPPTTRTPAMDAAFHEGENRAIQRLEELRRRDPVAHRSQVILGKLDRLIATTPESHPGYKRILCEWREARGIHVGEREWAEVGGR